MSYCRRNQGQQERGGIVSNTANRGNKAIIGNRHSGKEIMTCEEVADYLRVHVSSVRRWSRSGKLTAYKVGGRADSGDT